MHEETEPRRVMDLTTRDAIIVLGRRLRVVHVLPADRGGDFYLFEAIEYMDGGITSVLTMTLDKNTEVDRVVGFLGS